MDDLIFAQNDQNTHGQHISHDLLAPAASAGCDPLQSMFPGCTDVANPSLNGSQQGFASQAGLADLAFVDMVNQAQNDGEDLLGSLWQSSYNIYAGPWNPVGMNNVQDTAYPSYRPGPATEPVFNKHALSICSQDYADSAYFSGYPTDGLSPTAPDSGATTGPGATPPEQGPETPGLMPPKPTALRSRRNSGDGVMGPPMMRPRRLSTKSDKPLPPCEICLREGKGKRVPKNYADAKKHRLTHTRPYTCPVPGCPRQPSFATQNDLERHARGCHGIETRLGTHHYYKCNVPLCPKGNRLWDRRDNFRQHLQRIHKELTPDSINACLKSAVYHPTEAELKAYHASKKTSSGRRHRTMSEYGGTVTTLDDLSTIAGPNDTGSDSPRISSLQPEFITGGFGGIDFSVPPLPGPAFDPHWLSGLDDMNITQFDDQTQASMPNLMTGQTSTSLHLNNGLVDTCFNPALDFTQIAGSQPTNMPLDPELAGLLGIDTSGLGANQHIKGVDQPLHQSPTEMTPAVPSPPPLTERRDSANPQLGGGQLKCSYCDKRVARSCDLTKHEKRHTKPFGCTFPKCNKLFGSKNDWKRHEISVHSSPATWRCDIDGCNLHQPARFFYDKSFLLEHFEREHHLASLGKDSEAECDRLRIDGTGGNRFWCGFCQSIIVAGQDPKSAGFVGAEARLRHIGDHYDRGENKCDYSCLEMNRGKGYLWSNNTSTRTTPTGVTSR